MCNNCVFIEINYIFIGDIIILTINYITPVSKQMKTKAHTLLNFKVLDEMDIGPMIYRLYEHRIFHAIVKSGEKVSMEMTTKGYEFLDRNGGGRFYNLYQFESYAEMDPEVRTWAADTSGNHYTHCDAIVITNLAQKIIANFYIKFNKPQMPTKVFTSTEKAIEWIFSMMEKEDK